MIKIGDDIICLKKDTYAPRGTTGKVVAIDKVFGYLIKWNRNVGGFGDEMNKIPYGFGEYMQDFQIEKIVKVQTKKIFPEKIKSKDEIIEGLKKELAITKKAFDLMSIVLCTGARDDLKRQLGKFTLREGVKDFFLEQAEKEN